MLAQKNLLAMILQINRLLSAKLTHIANVT